eukprot:6141861-Amphidinium_carterae.1
MHSNFGSTWVLPRPASHLQRRQPQSHASERHVLRTRCQICKEQRQYRLGKKEQARKQYMGEYHGLFHWRQATQLSSRKKGVHTSNSEELKSSAGMD